MLIKYGAKEHMHDLICKGEVYMQRLSEFRLTDDSSRKDENEGLSLYLTGKVEVTVNDQVVDTVGAVKCIDTYSLDPFIFSMYSFNPIRNLNRDPLIDTRCEKFGEYAVIIESKNREEFMKRFVNSVRKTYTGKIECQLIEYVDPHTYTGTMGVFKKLSEYSYESEYRLTVEDRSSNDRNTTISLGCLQDIASLVPSSSLNGVIRVEGE